ncbi:MAG: pseudouridine synthase [Chloroflexi bacterium]|nr:pseudouridine synthase [Chloroflexota bacterium]
MTTLLFYKPYGVVSTFADDEPDAGRRTLRDYVDVPGLSEAGRLDHDSEGLLVLTDDGDLAHRLTHPQFAHPKTYCAQVEGIATDTALEPMRHGIVIGGRHTLPAVVSIIPPPQLPPRSKPVRSDSPTTWLQIELREGKKRQIRHMTAAVGFPTLRLVRVAIGPLALGDMQPGQWRALSDAELNSLQQSLSVRPAGRRATHSRATPRGHTTQGASAWTSRPSRRPPRRA